MVTTTEKKIDVVVLFVDDQPKGLWTEKDITNYTGNVWWDYVEFYTISESDMEIHDVDSIVWKYQKTR